jgi:hypothetical protein
MGDSPFAARARFRALAGRDLRGALVAHVTTGRPCRVVCNADLIACVWLQPISGGARFLAHLATLQEPPPGRAKRDDVDPSDRIYFAT